jgi:hypothetical protein
VPGGRQTGCVPEEGWPRPPGGWPPRLWQVPYLLSAGPDSDAPASWLDGSNCQRFAYGVLALFGRACPPLRSSDLWEDRSATAVVQHPEPLDLMLYNRTADPFGAHVTVWMGPGEILHLCHEVGVPAIWSPAMFADRPRYATLIGCKRVTSPDIRTDR